MPAVAQDTAPKRLAALAATAAKLGARTGLLVRCEGEVVFELRGNEAFVPASNMKLATALLGLETLGIDYLFPTRFYLHEREGKRVLRVVPGGDPCLASGRAGLPPYFKAVATALGKQGVTEIDALCLDGRKWTGEARPAGWPEDQLHMRYAAPTGPFVLDEGCFHVRLTAGPGKRCRVAIEPAGFAMPVRGVVEATASRKAGRKPGVWMARDGVRVHGKMWRGAGTATYTFAAPDPTAVFEQVLRTELRSQGIALGPRTADAPEGEGELVHELLSPLTWSLRRLLEESNNFHAEQLLRVVALRAKGEASLEAGRALLEERFREVGGSAWRAADGSGLSRENRASPALFCHVLERVLCSDYRRTFVEALPQNGVSGSLDDRMLGLRGRVRAKTGWIRGASSLSGTVLTSRGKVVVFSILMSYDRRKRGLNPKLKGVQDRMVAALHELL